MDQQLLMKRILVVDDELDSNLTLKLVLEDNGFKVDAFTDPLLALENLKAGLYVMLILDKNMPKMSGPELYNEIKKIDNKARVCFLTATETYRFS
jgi:DNA-binding response OmpR family regulator